jgi:hypothetical protein
MQITKEEAATILEMFGYAARKGRLSGDARELVKSIFNAFPDLWDAKDDGGLYPYRYRLD